MQRQLISAAVLLVLVAAATAIDMEKLSTRDYDYNATCMERLGSHIQVELQASITYLTMVNSFSSHSSLFSLFRPPRSSPLLLAPPRSASLSWQKRREGTSLMSAYFSSGPTMRADGDCCCLFVVFACELIITHLLFIASSLISDQWEYRVNPRCECTAPSSQITQ